MPETEKIGIIGGTFDPVHYGHMLIAKEMCTVLGLQHVLFIPAPSPPHKNPLDISAFRHRYAMTELAIHTELGSMYEVSDIEAARTGKSYSIDTLRSLRQRYPHAELYFLMGMDSFAELTSWKEYRKLFELSNIVVARRPGTPPCTKAQDLPVALRRLFCYDAARDHFSYIGGSTTEHTDSQTDCAAPTAGKLYFLGQTWVNISSTEIRTKVRRFEPIDALVPAAVNKYIEQNNLYRPQQK